MTDQEKHTPDHRRSPTLELLLGAAVPAETARRWRITPRRLPDADIAFRRTTSRGAAYRRTA